MNEEMNDIYNTVLFTTLFSFDVRGVFWLETRSLVRGFPLRSLIIYHLA